MSSHKIKAPYKRWFPVNHDINRDPDILEMIRQFGEKAFRVWMELLSIADRNEGYLPGRLSRLAESIGRTCATPPPRVAHIVGYLSSRRIIVYDLGGGLDRSRRVAKWAKYHRTQKPISGDSETKLTDTRPSEPSLNLSDPLKKESHLSESGKITDSDFCESWNEYFDGKLPKIHLPLTASREKKLRLRLRDHPGLAFWQEVFKGIWASDFLMGRNGTDWRASFDWLIDNDKNCLKVAEGNYVNKDSTRTP